MSSCATDEDRLAFSKTDFGILNCWVSGADGVFEGGRFEVRQLNANEERRAKAGDENEATDLRQMKQKFVIQGCNLC